MIKAYLIGETKVVGNDNLYLVVMTHEEISEVEEYIDLIPTLDMLCYIMIQKHS